MRHQHDWPATKERLTALWEGRTRGRPCIAVTAPNGQPAPNPFPPGITGEQRWLDPDLNLRALRAVLAATHYGGEALPGWLMQSGWTVNCYGATPQFSPETIWFDPVAVDWDNPPKLDLDWADPMFGKVLAMHQAILGEAGRDGFVVGQGCFLPGNDMLAQVVGTQELLAAMGERPEWVKAAILKVARNWVTLVRHFHELSRRTCDFWYGTSGWMTCWFPEPFVAAQSDLSCMISTEMFDEFVLPELDLIGAAFGNVWYHLDGQGAYHHLPRLLSLPYLKVMQFSPEAGGPGNGPAHLDLYRKIQAAGKIVHLLVAPDQVEPLVKALDPARLLLETRCRSVQEADELLARADGWAR